MTAPGSSARFYVTFAVIGGSYAALIIALLAADLQYATSDRFWAALQSPEIRYAIKLSIVSCTVTTVLSLWVGVPLGYLLSRVRFPGKVVLDTLLDIPIVLPPLVIGLSLLILMQTAPGKYVEYLTDTRMGKLLLYGLIPVVAAIAVRPAVRALVPRLDPLIGFVGTVGMLIVGLWLTNRYTGWEEALQARFGTEITYGIPSVILAQFAVCCAFAVRTMRVTFDQISPRAEQVALTLGCTRSQAFWAVTLPEARQGLVTAACIAWARALGEFGPILIFSGATRMRTEVLSTTVYLELNIGHLEAAIAVSLMMVVVAVVVLVLMRAFGLRGGPA
ncbi:MAG TPA: ABC transporter permease subunit [Gemmataceae bacterium]|nr:ABC transporter permease subunit [Gemmataceae bacterium]